MSGCSMSLGSSEHSQITEEHMWLNPGGQGCAWKLKITNKNLNSICETEQMEKKKEEENRTQQWLLTSPCAFCAFSTLLPWLRRGVVDGSAYLDCFMAMWIVDDSPLAIFFKKTETPPESRHFFYSNAHAFPIFEFDKFDYLFVCPWINFGAF